MIAACRMLHFICGRSRCFVVSEPRCFWLGRGWTDVAHCWRCQITAQEGGALSERPPNISDCACRTSGECMRLTQGRHRSFAAVHEAGKAERGGCFADEGLWHGFFTAVSGDTMSPALTVQNVLLSPPCRVCLSLSASSASQCSTMVHSSEPW